MSVVDSNGAATSKSVSISVTKGGNGGAVTLYAGATTNILSTTRVRLTKRHVPGAGFDAVRRHVRQRRNLLDLARRLLA